MIAAALVFANIPGRIELEPREHGFQAGPCIEHGWPWPFVRRAFDVTIRIHLSYGTWDSAVVAGVGPGLFWAIARHVQEVDFAGLAMNIAVAVVVLAVGTVLFEAWRRRRARLLQFYLIELFALMTAACVLLSWLSVQMRDRREEQDALWRMWNFTLYEEEAAGPHWLRHLVGPRPFQMFDHVRQLSISTRAEDYAPQDQKEILSRKFKDPEDLSHLRHLRQLDCGREPASIVRFLPRPDRLECLECDASDAGLAEIHRCQNLQVLKLHTSGHGEIFSESGMARLETLTNLRELDLGGLEVSDAALSHLEKLPRLEALRLAGYSWIMQRQQRGAFDVTDACVDCLLRFPRLRALDLSWSSVSDTGLGRLARLKGLMELRLHHTLVTDAGLKYLQDWGELQTLDLSDTRVSDAGLEHLEGLTRLQQLWLDRTKTSDAGLEHLRGLTGLQWLRLYSTPVSGPGVKKLQRALPGCAIVH
jgi:hypothetical protein